MAKILGVHDRNKIQIKIMTGSSDTTQYLDELKFNNLVIGKLYRISYNIYWGSSGVSDPGVVLTCYNADNTTSNEIFTINCQPAAGVNRDTLFGSKVFTAVSSYLCLRHVDSASGAILASSASNYGMLEELDSSGKIVTNFT